MNDPVIVKSFTDKGEAEIARGLLEAEGINAAITADDLGSEGPGMNFGRPINLVVDAADADRANELLDQAAEDAAEEEDS
jgi:putative signal transducing protein